MTKKLASILAAIVLLPSCIFNVLDTSDRLDRRSGVILDTQRNRNSFVSTYDRSINREYKGESQPPAYANWNAMWEQTYNTLKKEKIENPSYYIGYIKQRRKELGLSR